MLGVTKDAILRLDETTKAVLKTRPLEKVKRWAATEDVFTVDFGEYQDGFYSVQTPEAEKISELVTLYINVKNRENLKMQNVVCKTVVKLPLIDQKSSEN